MTTARILASKDRQQLGIAHLRAAVQFYQDFDDDVMGAMQKRQMYN